MMFCCEVKFADRLTPGAVVPSSVLHRAFSKKDLSCLPFRSSKKGKASMLPNA